MEKANNEPYWVKPKRFPCSATNPTILNLSYSPFGDCGSHEDIEQYIRQRLDDKRIPYDYDLDIGEMAELVACHKSNENGLLCSQLSIEMRLNKAAEMALQQGHTKITFETNKQAREVGLTGPSMANFIFFTIAFKFKSSAQHLKRRKFFTKSE